MDDPVLRYVSIENFKHFTAEGAHTTAGDYISVLAHTSIPYYSETEAKHEEVSLKIAAVTEAILASINKVLPLPPHPVQTHLHSWDVSQVAKSFKDGKHKPSMWSAKLRKEEDEEKSGRLIIAGDMFVTSNFEGCAKSAKAAAMEIFRCVSAKQA